MSARLLCHICALRGPTMVSVNAFSPTVNLHFII